MKIIKYLPLTFVVDNINGANGRHNILYIEMDKNAPNFDAVLAQELYEWWLVTRWSLIVCAIGASSFWWLGDDSDSRVLSGILTFFGYIAPRLAFHSIGFLNRYMEFRGHAVEIEYAVNNLGADLQSMIDQEVRSLTGYKSFKGWAYLQIENEMLELLAKRGNVKL